MLKNNEKKVRTQEVHFSRKLLAIPYLAFIAVFVAVPLVLIIIYAFSDGNGHFTFKNAVEFFTNADYINSLVTSAIIGIANTAICLLIGYPLAYILAKKEYKFNFFMVILFIMPMWINFISRTYATRDLLHILHLSNYSLVSTMIGMVYNFLPFVILPLYTTMIKMDKSVIEAANDLGAKPYQTFFRVIIPMSYPGILSAISMVFVPTMSSYAITDILGNAKVSVIGSSINLVLTTLSQNMGSFMALIMLIIMGISMFLTRKKDKTENVRGGLW